MYQSPYNPYKSIQDRIDYSIQSQLSPKKSCSREESRVSEMSNTSDMSDMSNMSDASEVSEVSNITHLAEIREEIPRDIPLYVYAIIAGMLVIVIWKWSDYIAVTKERKSTEKEKNDSFLAAIIVSIIFGIFILAVIWNYKK